MICINSRQSERPVLIVQSNDFFASQQRTGTEAAADEARSCDPSASSQLTLVKQIFYFSAPIRIFFGQCGSTEEHTNENEFERGPVGDTKRLG